MKLNIRPTAFSCAIFASVLGLALSTTQLSAQSLAISGVISQTVGGTATITGSGSAANTTNWSPGTVGVFNMGAGTVMRVSATNPTGPLPSGPTSDSLMVARTVNSQGLTDTGTLSVYVRPTSNTRWNLNLNFSFFTDASFTVPKTINNMMLTSLDIDFNQRYYTSRADMPTVVTYPGTNITSPVAISGFNGFTASGDSLFSNAKHAVSTVGTGNSFNVKLSHDSLALYMFEFRNPSNVVPEPSSAILLMGGLTALGLIRRRDKTA